MPGSDGRIKARTICYKCNKRRYFADFCLSVEEGVVQNLITTEVDDRNKMNDERNNNEAHGEEDKDDREGWNDWNDQQSKRGDEKSDSDDSLLVSFQLMELGGKPINKGSYKDADILIDTGPTTFVFINPNMLINIRRSDKTLMAYSNGGFQDSNLKGTFPGMFDVWYNHESMLNILSFKDVRKHFRITIDTAVENCINVHLMDGTVLRFEEVESGLYFLHSNTNTSNQSCSNKSGWCLI